MDTDYVRVFELCNRAIDEGAIVFAMTNLARLLEKGAHRVVADPAQAVDLHPLLSGHS